MTVQSPIGTDVPWYRLDADDADWAAEAPGELSRWLGQMMVIRRFEERILELSQAGLVHGPAHASIGQEAGAVGAMSLLSTTDRINGTHRAHHQVLAKLLNASAPEGFDPRCATYTHEMADAVTGLMAEIMGLSAGFCGGRGGSMHMRCEAAGIPGTSAIIGGNLPHAAGAALADKLLGRPSVTVSFFGDGTMMAGQAYEAMNIAALYRLPAIFFAENNLYAVSTHIAEQTRETRLSSRGIMLGFPAIVVDGMDVVAVRRAMAEALAIIRTDGGPVMIEALCYRFLHQMGPRPGSEFGYRSAEEEAHWRGRDPIETAARRLQAQGVLDAAGVAHLDRQAVELVAEAARRLTEPVAGTNRLGIPDRLWPRADTVDAEIRGDLSEFAGRRFAELSDFAAEDLEEVRFIQAASEVLANAMDRDPRVVIIGEDVHRLRGGVSGATKDALERWPERVLAMPIAENGFTGIALGAALAGLRPVVEIMFGDFCLVAADQLFNGIGKVRHMFGGGFPVPIVLRVRISPHSGYGSQHSGDPSGLFAMFPGWRIVAPTTPFDMIGLMNAALLCDDPVVVIESVELFQTAGPVPKGGRDHLVRLGSARTVRAGSAATVLASAGMVSRAVEAAEATGIDVEIIDLRTLDPTGLDWTAVEASLKRTNRVMIAEQTQAGLTLGPRIAAEIQRRFFDHLDHEILCVSGGLAAPTVSAPLNRAALGTAADVATALQTLVSSG